MTTREKVILEGQETVSKAAKEAAGGMDQLSDTIKKIGAAAGVAYTLNKIKQIGVASLQMAVDAGESAAAFETTFGPAVDRVGDFVEDFANKAGFAEFQLQQMLATTGAVAQGIGFTEQESARLSIRMATLAGDVASFSNAAGGAEAVLAALQSSINGEREALKTYGLAISEAEVQQRALAATGKTNADQLTRQEKALATVEIAYEKAGKMVGDLDRTQDSAANSMRRITAMFREAGVAIGEDMLPALEQILPNIEATIPAATRLGQALVNAIVGPAAASSAALPRLTDGLAVLVNYATQAAGTLGYVATELVTFGRANTEADRAMAANAATMNDLIGVAEAMRQGKLDEGPLGLANAMGHLQREGTLTETSLQELIDMFGLTSYETAQAAQTLLDYGNVADRGLRHQLEQLVDTEKEQASATYESAEAARFARIQQQALADSTDDAGAAYKTAQGHLDPYIDSLIAAYQAGETLASGQLAAIDPVYDAIDAWSRYQDTLADVNEDGKVTAEEFLELTKAQLEMQDATNGLTAAEYEAFMSAMQDATGKSRDELQLLLDELGLFDGRTFTATVETRFSGAAGIGRGFGEGQNQAFANGGIVQGPPGAPVAATVHAGEEVISISDRSQIIDILRGMATTGGGGGGGNREINVTIPITVADTRAGQTVLDQLQDPALEATLERLTRNL